MPKPYPKEFRDDVVNVARNRQPGQHLKQIAADFGISESCLTNWMKAADVEDGVKPGTTAAENADLREPPGAGPRSPARAGFSVLACTSSLSNRKLNDLTDELTSTGLLPDL
ncbi:transposase [Modestobacter marinus]|uniref:transposase n=1 Tax=Modestobacter marinus TaxID=477641 RepID=UPI003570E43A